MKYHTLESPKGIGTIYHGSTTIAEAGYSLNIKQHLYSHFT